MSVVPPGWTHNPSAWGERLHLVGVATLGFVIAAYLTLYQLGVFRHVFEPFFGNGSEVILHSGISRLLPVPDAALGAAAYLLDAVSGLLGGQARWREAPWAVLLFGFAVGPLGGVSLLLVILQPLLYGHWCTLCLSSAFLSISLIGPAMDEVLASMQHLAREGRRGHSRWRAFWGRAPEGA